MSARPRLALALALAAASIAACSGARPEPQPPPALDVMIRGTAETGCHAEVEGRALTPDELEAWARTLARAGREAHLRGSPDLPYRCVGHIVYALQRAGFTRIGFISEPAR
jgi:biopolymer transport protein ExbD